MAEAFFATIKRELLRTRRFATRAEAASAIFEWIEVSTTADAGTPRSEV